MFRRISSLAAALLALLVASPAWACGGFFCFTQPIDQSTERIFYVVKPGKISVHIQISYQGEDSKFSWLLPLQKVPTLGTGSEAVFTVLEQLTAPLFYLEQKNKDGCWGPSPCMASAAEDGGTKGGGGVQVLQQVNVGPYDTVTIGTTEGGKAEDVIKWLNDNGYQQPKESAALIQKYVDQKFVFLALKLQKDKKNGDLVPIVVNLDEPNPCLPLRLTAIAATEDMPIAAWVLGDARAIPKNFLHVELNEAAIDWLQGGNNYKTVVSKAVDLASGHAFTTEYAQQIGPQDTNQPWPFVQTDFTERFARPSWKQTDLASAKTPQEFLQKLMTLGLPNGSQLQNLIRKYLPKPEKYKDVTDQEFYGCIQNGSGDKCGEYQAAVATGFDAGAFAKALKEGIIDPLYLVQDEFSTGRWLTRLYTTVSPVEMNKDPIFAFNGTLPKVSNVHKASGEPICAGGNQAAQKMVITFADGHQITVDVPKEYANGCWGFGFGGGAPVQVGQGTQPVVAAGGQPVKSVQVLDEMGAPLEVQPGETADKVDAELNNAVVGKPSLSEDFKKTLPKVSWDPYKGGAAAAGATSTAAKAESDGGCSAGPDGRGLGAVVLAGLACLLVWRRRYV
jgi:hypothetical protein